VPAFALLFQSILTALGGFFFKIFVGRVAIRIAAVAAIAVLGTGLMALFNTVVSPLVAQLFTTQYGQLIGLVFPPIAGTCLAGIATLWLACTTYSLQVGAIKATANI
jgi:hypothetical protein